MNKPLIALLATVAAFAAAPSHARAGSYVVVGCADLAGALGPGHVVRPAEGWFLEHGIYPSHQGCAAGRGGRGIFATGSREPNLFRLDAPAHTTIDRLVITYRAHLSAADRWAFPLFVVQAGHGGSWELVYPARGHSGTQPIDFGGDRVVGDMHRATAVRVGTRCDLGGPCVRGGQPAVRVHATAVMLVDDRAPRVSLAPPAGHAQGTLDIPIAATDEGGGVFERSLAVDGRPLAGGALCATVPASVGRVRHVVRRVPCPLDAPARVRLDTRTLPDGRHELVARAEDVAGNARTAEARIVVDNRPPNAGTVALAGDAAVSEALTAVPSGFSGQDPVYAYRWQRCDAWGLACKEIGGAVELTYALRPGDAGRRVRAVVSATDGGGTVQAVSPPSPIVAGASTGPSGAPSPAPAAAPRPDAGRLTAWLARGRRRARSATVTWPARVRIRCRLADRAGRPLDRAPVRMLQRVDGRGWRALTSLRTNSDGRLTALTAIGPSRRIRLVHGAARVTLRLRVRPAARLRVLRVGGVTVVFGRLLGGRVPRAGARLRLQLRRGPGWSTRAVLRTDGLGRFAASGRAPAGVGMRIAIPAQRGYPFAAGVARP
jgi:hypothetical protein